MRSAFKLIIIIAVEWNCWIGLGALSNGCNKAAIDSNVPKPRPVVQQTGGITSTLSTIEAEEDLSEDEGEDYFTKSEQPHDLPLWLSANRIDFGLLNTDQQVARVLAVVSKTDTSIEPVIRNDESAAMFFSTESPRNIFANQPDSAVISFRPSKAGVHRAMLSIGTQVSDDAPQVELVGTAIRRLPFSLNRQSDQSAGAQSMTVWNGRIYVVWTEPDTVGLARVRVSSADPLTGDVIPLDNQTSGLNYAAFRNSYSPMLRVHDDKLYATWHEENPANVRVSVFNGNDDSPRWTRVDGGATLGVTYSRLTSQNGQLFSFGGRLFLAFSDYNASGVYQVRIAVYNNDDAAPNWTFVDSMIVTNTGLNNDPTKNARYPVLTDAGGALYVVWQEETSTGLRLFFSKFNGDIAAPSWTNLTTKSGLAGLQIKQNSTYPTLKSGSNRIWLAWYESESGGNRAARVAEYSLITERWTLSGMKEKEYLNIDGLKDVWGGNLALDGMGNTYYCWVEANIHGTYQVQLKTMTAGAKQWTSFASDPQLALNLHSGKPANQCNLIGIGEFVVAGWSERDANNVAKLGLTIISEP